MSSSTNFFWYNSNTQKYEDLSNVLQIGPGTLSTPTRMFFGSNKTDLSSYFYFMNNPSYAPNPTKYYFGGVDLSLKATVTNNLIGAVKSSLYTNTSTITDGIDSGKTWNMSNASFNNTRKTVALTGSGSYILFNNGGAMTNWSGTTLTLIVYYYRTVVGTGACLFNINRSPSNIANEAKFSENSYFDYDGTNYGLNFSFTDNGTNYPIGWMMYAFVKNGKTGTAYLNGVANGTSTVATAVTLGNATINVGSDYRDSNSYLPGEIFFAGVWNTALSASNIVFMYKYLTNSRPQ